MSHSRRFRLLLVDDDPCVREVLSDFLRFLGHEVDGAASGAEAIKKFGPGRYHAVVTDLLMPGLSGWDVTEGVRQVDALVPIIIVTGGATALDTERARGSGFPLLLKPVRIEDLETTIGQAVSEAERKAAAPCA